MFSKLEEKQELQILDKHYKYLVYEHKNKWIAKLFNEAGFSISRTREELTRSYAAFKCFFKYSLYLDELNDHTIEEYSRFVAWHDLIMARQYPQVKKDFDALFSESDWEQAHRYFEDHPTEFYAGSKNKLMYSYLKANNQVIRRNVKPLGEGGFGRVTDSCIRGNPIDLVTKRQSSQVEGFFFKDCVLEAEINRQLGIAYSDLIVRIKHGEIYKVYQVMHYLGEPLLKVLKGTSLAIKLDYSIKLLVAVRDLHSGVKSGTPLAHRDIKPDNVLINEQNKTVHLIDFGFAQDTLLDEEDFLRIGTMSYWPCNLNRSNYLLEFPTTRFFDDTVAAVRTIYYPENRLNTVEGIFNYDEFYSFPQDIQDILDTTIVSTKYSKDTSWTVSLIAASLILLQTNHELDDDELIFLLSQNKMMQDELIDCYTKGLDIPILSIEKNGRHLSLVRTEKKQREALGFFKSFPPVNNPPQTSLFAEFFNYFKMN